MQSLDLARLQFAVTTVYHFFFVPLTLGLGVTVAIMQTLYYRSGNDTYKRMTKFWGKLFLINFAMGVVTGIVQEFQFGMNWSEYSRFVGDIFGAPLAIEALMAFFIESTFLGLWLFGWDRLSKKVHLATIWLVAIFAIISAFWILVANSFMQNPVGFTMNNGRAEMTDFLALITNPNVLLQFPHVVAAGLSTGAFFVLGISAYHLLRNIQPEARDLFTRSFNIAALIGLIGIVMTIVAGHAQAQHMADTQPMKLAAAEGLWESADPASLSFFQIGDEANRREVVDIRIPSLLSFMVYNTPGGLVQGINPLQEQYAQQYGPGDYVPPYIWLNYWSFRAMVGAGFAMAALAAYALFLRYRRSTFARQGLFLRLLVLAIVLPYLANSTGWLLTEVGRQPWIVYGLQLTADAVSPNVTPAMLWITLIGFTLVYGALAVADVYLLQKFARRIDGEVIGELPTQPEPKPAMEGLF